VGVGTGVGGSSLVFSSERTRGSVKYPSVLPHSRSYTLEIRTPSSYTLPQRSYTLQILSLLSRSLFYSLSLLLAGGCTELQGVEVLLQCVRALLSCLVGEGRQAHCLHCSLISFSCTKLKGNSQKLSKGIHRNYRLT